jgi:hypothetical protein
MDNFDNEIERTVNRAGRTAFGLNLVAMVLVALTLLAFAGIGNNAASYIGPGEGILILLVAAGLHALATLIHLNSMQLMETWRQGRRGDHQPS